QPIDDGEFRFVGADGTPTVQFEKGVVKAFRDIRHIRILDKPMLTLSDGSVWQPVRYDADAELEDVVAGGSGGRIPIRDHEGFIQRLPTTPDPNVEPHTARIVALFQKLGAPVGGPVDGAIRVGRTLETQLSSIFADAALDDAPGGPRPPALIVAAY